MRESKDMAGNNRNRIHDIFLCGLLRPWPGAEHTALSPTRAATHWRNKTKKSLQSEFQVTAISISMYQQAYREDREDKEGDHQVFPILWTAK